MTFSLENSSAVLPSLNPSAHVRASVLNKTSGCPCPRLLLAACQSHLVPRAGWSVACASPGPVRGLVAKWGTSRRYLESALPAEGSQRVWRKAAQAASIASGSPGGARGHALSAGRCSWGCVTWRMGPFRRVRLADGSGQRGCSHSSEGLLVSASSVSGLLGLRGWHGCLPSEEKGSFHSSYS